ncbi:MAG: tetratricopeptide repeat protein [Hyphomicrobium aestuarii]|nr:tetratricopeptide repeat protein [Hyphomicrobium aestuarii]
MSALLAPAASAAERATWPPPPSPPQIHSIQAPPGSPEAPGARRGPNSIAPKIIDPKDVDPKSMPIPDKPSERQKLLENLYAYLATAASKDEAEPIAATIERLWLLRGTDTSFYLMERARVALQQNDTASAVVFLDQVVDLAPDYAEGWLRRAYLHILAGDKERALGDLRRCLALEPSHFQALRATGMIFLDNGQNAAALKAFEKLLEIHPQDTDTSKIVDDLRLKVEGQKT